MNSQATAKRIFAILMTFLCAGSTFGQGTLQFGNNFSGVFRAPIYGLNPRDVSECLYGQSPLGVPPGTTVFGGSLLQGTGFTMALFAGPMGAAEQALQLVATTTFRTATGNVIPAGLVQTTTVIVNGIPAGSIASLQVRVWDNLGGTVTSWAQVMNIPPGQVTSGKSGVFASAPLGGPDPSGGEPIVSPIMDGWASFNIGCLPEPSTFAVFGMGLVAIWLRRRCSS